MPKEIHQLFLMTLFQGLKVHKAWHRRMNMIKNSDNSNKNSDNSNKMPQTLNNNIADKGGLLTHLIELHQQSSLSLVSCFLTHLIKY